MSQHHRRDWPYTETKKWRAILTPQLPLPCLDGCGKPVLPGQRWQVGHRIPKSKGGQNIASNIGASHTSCNLRAGGKLGAIKTNKKHKSQKDLRAWW